MRIPRLFLCLLLAIPTLAEEPPPEKVALWQIALDRKLFSPGCIDGKREAPTRLVIKAWQATNGLKADGIVGPQTEAALGIDVNFAANAFIQYTITAEDLASLGKVPESWRERSTLKAMAYETPLELVAEKFHATQDFIRSLNPTVNWDVLAADTSVKVPNVATTEEFPHAAKLHISLTKKVVGVFNASDQLVALFPCSIAHDKAKRPVGELKVVAIAPHPNYTFDPKIFPESPEARQIGTKLIIPPGPNNPVGAVWVSLSREGYGVHGTPKPEDIGKTESHGCFRLANWNAERLLKMISIGTPVFVEAE